MLTISGNIYNVSVEELSAKINCNCTIEPYTKSFPKVGYKTISGTVFVPYSDYIEVYSPDEYTEIITPREE